MRARLVLVVAALSAVRLGASSAAALPFEGTLTVVRGQYPFGIIAGSGEGVSTPAAVSLTSGGFLTTLAEQRPPETTFTRLEIGFPGGLSGGSWSAGGGPGGGFGGDAAMTGKILANLTRFLQLVVPLSAVGVEGATAVATNTPAVRLRGGGWTTGRLVTTGLSPVQSTSGRDARTPSGAGNLVLVSATAVDVGDSFFLTVFSRLDLTFADPAPGVPEPGALLLFGLGAAWIRRSVPR